MYGDILGYVGFRVQVPNNQVLDFRVIVMMVQVLGKYMIIRYLDPKGLRSQTRAHEDSQTEVHCAGHP